ncbi:MAG: type 4a pilus biogenesis protein PilO [Gammaproteobacteria bacterium]|nr:type 4a pilus biogenesis protein PilO [Gammaproteobacteria bacterium]NNJ73254.1 type 4a pilus biogenesis protein PilO [Enterobacterales bacterium]
MNFDLDQFKNLDFDNVGDWPGVVKGFFTVLVFALVVGAVYYFDTTEQIQRLETSERQELDLRSEFEDKQRKAVNLDDYRLQMTEMCESFRGMLRQLPTNTEIPGLIDDISQSEAYSGLEFKATKYLKERKAEFYTEKPVSIEVTGNYHQLGLFVSRVSSLPRIVTLHDLSIAKPKGSGRQAQSDTLTLKVLAKTYRYDSETDNSVCSQLRGAAK